MVFIVKSTTAAFSPARFEFDRELIARLDGAGPRYTSYPTADRFSPEFGEVDYRFWLERHQIGTAYRPLSLYVHLPFCDTICYYCGCNKVITKDRARAEEYLDYLELEIGLIADLLGGQERVVQLHFGGGTPTFLSDAQLERLMGMLSAHFQFAPDGEYSIEIDPRKVGGETIHLLARLGFNRVSVGVQDFDPAVQQAVNRIQSEEETWAVIEAARAAGFKSVSLDLIYGLPRQSEASVTRTIAKVLAMEPDRLALYNYAHLPALFKPQRRIDQTELPNPTVKLDILQHSVEQLTAAGYQFIGMDHFAKPEDELAQALRHGLLQRNFQGYSTYADCDLIGLGVSSIGMFGPCYVQNHKDIDAYKASLSAGQLPVLRGLTLTQDDILRRSIIQALMCRFMLSIVEFEETYDIVFADYFAAELAAVIEFERMGLLRFDGDCIFIEPRGRFLIRNIAMIFDRYLRERQETARYSRMI